MTTLPNPSDIRLSDLIGKDDDGFFRVETVEGLTKDQAISRLISEVARLSHMNTQLKAFVAASCHHEDAPVTIVRGSGTQDIFVHRNADGTVQSALFLAAEN